MAGATGLNIVEAGNVNFGRILYLPEYTRMVLEYVLLDVCSHALHALLIVVGCVLKDAPLEPQLVFLTAFHGECTVSADIKGTNELDHSGACINVHGSLAEDLEADEAREVDTINIILRNRNKLILLLLDIFGPNIKVFDTVRNRVPIFVV